MKAKTVYFVFIAMCIVNTIVMNVAMLYAALNGTGTCEAWDLWTGYAFAFVLFNAIQMGGLYDLMRRNDDE